MIQDIAPLRMDNSFRNLQPKDSDRILFFEGQKLRVFHDPEARRLVFPLRRDFPAGAAFQYLFSISGSRFFLALEPSFFPDSSDPLFPRDAGSSGPDSGFSSVVCPVVSSVSGAVAETVPAEVSNSVCAASEVREAVAAVPLSGLFCTAQEPAAAIIHTDASADMIGLAFITALLLS